MRKCHICGEEIEDPRRTKYCGKFCAAVARRAYDRRYYNETRPTRLKEREERRRKSKAIKRKAFKEAIAEMQEAIETGHISLDHIRSKMGNFDKIPEVDFIPGIGSFVGTEPEWKIDARINRLKQKVKEEMTNDFIKKLKKEKVEIEIVRKGFGGSGRGPEIWTNAHYLIEIKESIDKLTATLEKSTKSLEKASKSLEKAAKELG